MRVRVIKKMPFASVGVIMDISKNIIINISDNSGTHEWSISLFQLIQGGWVEEVKEENKCPMCANQVDCRIINCKYLERSNRDES